MTDFDLVVYTLKFMIPSIFAILFRAFGMGYTNKHRLVIGLSVFILYLAVIPAVLITVMGYGQYTHIAFLVMTIASMSMLIFSNDTPGKTILLMLIVSQMNTMVSVPLNMVRHMFKLSYFTLDILLLISCAIIYVIGLRFWAKPLRFMADNLHGRLIAPILIPIVVMILIYVIPIFPVESFVNNPLYCTIIMMAIELIFFLYVYTLYRSLREISSLSEYKLNAELIQLSVVSMSERLRMMDEIVKQNSLRSHDSRHFNNTVLKLLEHGNSKQANDLLKSQLEIAPKAIKSYCQNQIVNAAVCYYADIAEEKGIKVEINLDIPTELSIDTLELSMAVSNLLENAINECKRLPKMAEKEITFTCHNVGRLALEIRNSCTDDTTLDENGYPVALQKGHGIGTKSVIAFAKKYDAELMFQVKNGGFRVWILV